MRKVKEQGATLPFDFEEDEVDGLRPLHSEAHLDLLRNHWGKFKPSNELFKFNKDLHEKHFKKDSMKFLKQVAGANIKHLSEWAQNEINSRAQ